MCHEIDKIIKVINYASRALTPAGKNYDLHKDKLKFSTFKWLVINILGLPLLCKEFSVYSDNSPLSSVLSSAKLNTTSIRWVSGLPDFKYPPGKKSWNCDYLSRYPIENEFTSIRH